MSNFALILSSSVEWPKKKITYHLWDSKVIETWSLPIFPPHTLPPGKIWPISGSDRIIWRDTAAPPPAISNWGAELAQMRDTLKNKLLIWDWVDSDGWLVLKGTAIKKTGQLGQLIISVDTKRWFSPSSGNFSIKRPWPLECAWANIHCLPSFIHWSCTKTFLNFDKTMVKLN